MRALVGIFVIVGLLAIQHTPVDAQQEGYVVSSEVREDTNADTVLNDIDDPLLSDWVVQGYSDTWDLLASEDSIDSGPSLLTSDQQITYVCIVPQSGWSQTTPLTAHNHPLSIEWFCHDTINNPEQELFAFGVVQSSNELEEIPGIIDEGSAEAIEKELPTESVGAVLGAIDEPEVLAETGSASLLSIGFGVLLSFGVISLAQQSKLD